MLVGDLIQATREAITDQAQVLVPPVLSSGSVVGGGGFTPGIYYVIATFITPWGETLPSNELSFSAVTPGATSAFSMSVGFPLGIASPQITKVRLYVGTAPGAEQAYQDFTVFSPSTPLVFNFITDTQAPPTRNTAYNPNTDGDAVGASTMFRWLNDALKVASQTAGGLLDYSGIGSVSGVPQYVVPGEWKKIASCWYDGYPLAMDDNGNYFRRNSITASVLSSVALSTFNNQMIFEVWPQPSRTAAQTTLAFGMTVGQTTAQLVSAAGFLLTNGFVQIGTEIMSYSQFQGSTLLNLQRGLSGTVQSVIQPGTAVQELNLFWSGWRMYNPAFIPGQASYVIPAPLGWETALFKYMLGRMKLSEQGVGDFEKLEQALIKQISDWHRQNKVVVGPRQIGEQTNGLETLPALGGGWIIP